MPDLVTVNPYYGNVCMLNAIKNTKTMICYYRNRLMCLDFEYTVLNYLLCGYFE